MWSATTQSGPRCVLSTFALRSRETTNLPTSRILCPMSRKSSERSSLPLSAEFAWRRLSALSRQRILGAFKRTYRRISTHSSLNSRPALSSNFHREPSLNGCRSAPCGSTIRKPALATVAVVTMSDETTEDVVPYEQSESTADISGAAVVFQDRRTVLPAANRVPWRLSVLVLTVAKCNGHASSIATLHLLMWGMRGRVPRSRLTSWLTGAAPADLVSSRLDPQLETTIRLAAAEQLVTVTRTGRVHLTERGKELAALIDTNQELLPAEKKFLAQIAPLSDASITRRMGGAIDGV